MSVTTQEAKFLSVPEVVGISASQTSKGLSEDDLESGLFKQQKETVFGVPCRLDSQTIIKDP